MNKIYLFDKEKFAQIIKNIKETYNSQEEFSQKSNIGRTYLSQYMNMKLDNRPTRKILEKLANASKGITTYQELMRICGYLDDNEIIITNKGILEQILELANGLSIQETNYLIKQLNIAKIQITKGDKNK